MCARTRSLRENVVEAGTPTCPESSPEGANQLSPGREPWVGSFSDTEPASAGDTRISGATGKDSSDRGPPSRQMRREGRGAPG